ncbi:MAG: recombinase family protein [Propionibacteriaceae bacterium]|jgi:DNA invertase Pin-like site-specific DNA recombinase|nr:recombinase family protein [Propionibacteriaceae bacterium]
MLAHVARRQIAYCIVHKADRLARNRADDAAIHLAPEDAGVTLVSATENIDETPFGMLMHGITSSTAEFYSRDLATEAVKDRTQKAKTGGTPVTLLAAPWWGCWPAGSGMVVFPLSSR